MPSKTCKTPIRWQLENVSTKFVMHNIPSCKTLDWSNFQNYQISVSMATDVLFGFCKYRDVDNISLVILEKLNNRKYIGCSDLLFPPPTEGGRRLCFHLSVSVCLFGGGEVGCVMRTN